jgi:hypothetical protein
LVKEFAKSFSDTDDLISTLRGDVNQGHMQQYEAEIKKRLKNDVEAALERNVNDIYVDASGDMVLILRHIYETVVQKH